MFKKIICGLLLLASSVAFATQEVRVYMPYSVGSSADMLGRWMTKKLSNSEYNFVMHIAPGAQGVVAMNNMDNFNGPSVIILSNSALTISNVDLDKKYEFVNFVGYEPTLFVTGATNPINNISDLNNESKKRIINFGHSGVGGYSHLSYFVMANQNKNFVDISYKTHTQALPDLIANRIDLLCIDLVLADPLIKGGQLKVVATNYHRRLEGHPNAPTMKEQHTNNYDYYRWMVLLSSKSTDPKIVEHMRNLFKDPATKAELRQFSVYYEDVNGKTFLKDQKEKLQSIEKTLGIQK